MFHFTFCNMLCVSVLCCIIQVAMTFSVCKYNVYTPQVDLPSNIKRWTHGFSKHTSLESDASRLTRYLCHDPCCVCVAKSNYHCCLLFRRIKYMYMYGHTSVLKIWDRLYVMVYMYLACTYLYMLYIYSTNRHGKEKMLKLLLENGPLCHDMALERTLSYSPTTPLASPLDAGRANICCRPGHRVLAQDHRLAAALNAGQRRSSSCNATCRQPSPKL